NDYLAQARRTGDWPSLFGLTGVYPSPWTPTDSLVLQGVLTQELDYTTTPLDYAILARTLGLRHTMAWFPIVAPGQHTPCAPRPSKYRGLSPIAPQAGQALTTATATTAAAKPAAARGPVAAAAKAPVAAPAAVRPATAGGQAAAAARPAAAK